MDKLMSDPRVFTLAAMWIVLIVGFWFLIARPKRKLQKEHRELIDSLRKGDQVVTVGGIHGEIVRVRQDTVTLQVAKGVEMRMSRAAIRRRQDDPEEET